MLKNSFRKHFHPHFNPRAARGQGLIETALLVPVLFLVLSGLIEFGFALNEFLTIQDAVRNAARFSSDSMYTQHDGIQDCGATLDFYMQTACLVNNELRLERPMIAMNDNFLIGNTDDDYLDPARGDDIVISVFSMGATGVMARFPTADGEAGWSYAAHLTDGLLYSTTTGTRNESSLYSTAQVTQSWVDVDGTNDNSTPSTGVLVVEVFYHYNQKFKLPWITAVVPDPLPMYFPIVMPLVSAEPTPTP